MSDTKKTTGKKPSKLIIAVAAILVLALIAGSFVINSDYFYTGTSAITIGDTEYTAAEFNYFYYSAFNQFYSGLGDYASQIIDTSKSLKDQFYTEGESFHDYFVEAAKTQMVEVTAAYNAAQATGLKLTAEQLEGIQEDLSNVELYAMIYGSGLTTDQYLAKSYGRGMTLELLEELLNKIYLASAYYAVQVDSYEYTEEELKAAYAENKDSYDIFTYNVVYLANNDDAEAAYAAADAIATAKDAEEFAQLVRDNVPEAQKAAYAEDESTLYTMAGMNLVSYEDYASWLMDSTRRSGDTTVIESSSGQGYYVLRFVERENNNYNTVSMRHVLINVALDAEGKVTDEAKAEALAKIEEIRQEYMDGPRTEASFAELANKYSEDGGSNTVGGLYERIAKGQMVKPVNDFLFLPRRAAGDIEIVYEENANYTGYHLLYFVDRNELYSDLIADSSLRAIDYDKWLTGQEASYTITENYSMKFVG